METYVFGTISPTNLSHNLMVQLPIIHRDTSTTIRQVPGHIVINVFNTNLVLKLIRFNAPILRDDASIFIIILQRIWFQIVRRDWPIWLSMVLEKSI
ncbi:hypothetical protein BLOT_015826 [Blomia tropicalis]|nr:hypothetical protein BLOT_015826 [Blomia tropicalis]